jgi:DNA-binding protein YbaB
VYNYLLNKPENDKICSIVDLNLTPNETKTLSEKICKMINDSNANVEFKFSAHNGNVRIIIAGEKNFVKQILLLI